MMEKLVRNGIPEEIRDRGAIPVTRYAAFEDKMHWLYMKAIEEAAEVLAGPVCEELGDLLEVVHAMAAHDGISMAEVEAVRLEKKERLGGFDKGIILTRIMEVAR